MKHLLCAAFVVLLAACSSKKDFTPQEKVPALSVPYFEAGVMSLGSWAIRPDELLNVGPALQKKQLLFHSAEQKYLNAQKLALSSPSKSDLLYYESVKELLQARLAELGISSSKSQSGFQLCKNIIWENLDCLALRDFETKPHSAELTTSLEDLNSELLKTFSELHKVTKLKQNLLNSCNRNILQRGPIEFIKVLSRSPLSRFSDRIRMLEQPFKKYSKLALIKNIPIEIWTGPPELVQACLPQLEYKDIKTLKENRWRTLYSAKLKGREHFLLIGTNESSWIYPLHLSFLLQAQALGREPNLLTLAPFKDPEKFYKDLAEIWYFYQIGINGRHSPDYVQVGYGPDLGTGRRFYREVLAQKGKLCATGYHDMGWGLLLRYSNSKEENKELLFLSTFLADWLTLPAYFIGEVLGNHGVVELGHWSTAGGLGDLKINTLFIPDSFKGFETKFFTQKLEPEGLSLKNNLTGPDIINPAEPLRIFQAGTLGSIFSSSIETESVERMMENEWSWNGVDTDAFSLFSGFQTANPSGKISGQYWISDESSSQGNTDSQAISGREQINQQLISYSNQFLARHFDIAELRCELP